MAVVESRLATQDARAARRSLRAQIAHMEHELAAILVETYPHLAQPAEPAVARAPRLLNLEQLEYVRDALAGRLATARRDQRHQADRQSRARALLAAMLADPAAYKGARVRNADLGLPGCTTYRVVPRLGPVGLLTGWWRVKVSSGCPLPANAGRRGRVPSAAREPPQPQAPPAAQDDVAGGAAAAA